MAQFTQSDLDALIAALNSRQSQMYSDFAQKASALGIKIGAGGIKAVQSLFEEGIKQAETYQEEIVGVYGDISLQQEEFGKSAAKLAYQQFDALNQSFLTMEAGGLRLSETFRSAEEAGQNAQDIINEFQGSAIQFTDDLQGTNLVMTQMLARAAGLQADATADLMKIAKARGEDSKQMLADIGSLSKVLADRFGLDTKMVAEEVSNITRDVATFGKVSVEAAAAAAAKFQSLGVSVQEVRDSLGNAFGSFDSASTAAAQLSQALGVNIDNMQMMVDVNSGPDGMLKAIDNLRESVIGAGVDVSELSAPLVRTFKQITGIADDKTLFSLFDPERAGVDTDSILNAAADAADAQKAPADALKMLSGDVKQVYRSLEEMAEIVGQQQLTRLGREASAAAKDFASLTSETTQLTNNLNVSLEKVSGIKSAWESLTQGVSSYSKVAAAAANVGASEVVNEAASRGVDIVTPQTFNAENLATAGRTAAEDTGYLALTGYQPSAGLVDRMDRKAATQAAVQNFFAPPANTPQAQIDAGNAYLASELGLPALPTLGGQGNILQGISSLLGAGSPPPVVGQPAIPVAAPAPAAAASSPATAVPTGVVGAPVTPGSATPPSPGIFQTLLNSVIGTANAAPAPVTPLPPQVPVIPAQVSPAPPPALPASTASTRAAIPGAGTAALASSSQSPIQLNLTISLDSKQIAQSVASTGQFVLQRT